MTKKFYLMPSDYMPLNEGIESKPYIVLIDGAMSNFDISKYTIRNKRWNLMEIINNYLIPFEEATEQDIQNAIEIVEYKIEDLNYIPQKGKTQYSPAPIKTTTSPFYKYGLFNHNKGVWDCLLPDEGTVIEVLIM